VSLLHSELAGHYWEVNWGLSSCARADCEEVAIIWEDTFGQLCAGCAEECMERQLVRAAQPELGELLPAWNDR
jgi:predicted sulfurtransferase